MNDRHQFRVRGLRFPTATCTCGWVSERHRSRGEARRAFDAHVWFATHTRMTAVFGTDAHRRQPLSADLERDS